MFFFRQSFDLKGIISSALKNGRSFIEAFMRNGIPIVDLLFKLRKVRMHDHTSLATFVIVRHYFISGRCFDNLEDTSTSHKMSTPFLWSFKSIERYFFNQPRSQFEEKFRIVNLSS